MAVPKSILMAKGSWRGKSKLNLPWLPRDKRVTESNSSLHIDTDSQEKIVTITYDWQYDGKREEGTLILTKARKSSAIEMGWVDSWHESDAVLHLMGEESATGSIKARGEYGAGKEIWGWSIELLPTETSLTIKMDNIPPTGEAMWAVEAVYSRE